MAPGEPGRFRDYLLHASRQTYDAPEWLHFDDLNVRTRYLFLRMEGANPNFGELRVCGNAPNHETNDKNLLPTGFSCSGLRFELSVPEAGYDRVQFFYSAFGGFTGLGNPGAGNPGTRSVVVPIDDQLARIDLHHLQSNTEYAFAYRFLSAAGDRSNYIHPSLRVSTLTCESTEPFTDLGVLTDAECSVSGLRWQMPYLRERGGHFEIALSEELVEAPEQLEVTRLPQHESGSYEYATEGAAWIYLRFVGYQGGTSRWLAWDTTVSPCDEVDPRADRYFGTPLPDAAPPINKIVIYPNPTDDILYLNADATYFTDYAIIDALGQTRQTGTTDPELRTMKLRTHTLRPGIYFLQLRGDHKRWQSVRFVIAR